MSSPEYDSFSSDLVGLLEANISHYLEEEVSDQGGLKIINPPSYNSYNQRLSIILGLIQSDELKKQFLIQVSNSIASKGTQIQQNPQRNDIFGLGRIGRTILENAENLGCFDDVNKGIEIFDTETYQPEAEKFFNKIRISASLIDSLNSFLVTDEEPSWVSDLREVFSDSVGREFDISPFIEIAVDISDWDALIMLLEYQAVRSTYISGNTAKAVNSLALQDIQKAQQELTNLEKSLEEENDQIRKYGISSLAFEYARALKDKEAVKRTYLRMLQASSVYGRIQPQSVGKLQDIIALYEEDEELAGFITEFLGTEYDPDDPETVEVSYINYLKIIHANNLHVPLAVFLANSPKILEKLKASERGKEVLSHILELCLNIRGNEYLNDTTGSFAKNSHKIARLYMDLNPDEGNDKLKAILENKVNALDDFYDKEEKVDQNLLFPPELLEVLGLSSVSNTELFHDTLVRAFFEVLPGGKVLNDSETLQSTINIIDSIPQEKLSEEWLLRMLSRIKSRAGEDISEGTILDSKFGVLLSQLKILVRYGEKLNNEGINDSIKELFDSLTADEGDPITVFSLDSQDYQDYRLHLILIQYLHAHGHNSFDSHKIVELAKKCKQRNDFVSLNELITQLLERAV